MLILHTSDWHIGRTFHGHSTLESLGEVLDALAGVVLDRGVDVVVVAGDIFDSATPSAASFGVLNRAVSAIRAAGASVVITSGNHDSAARLGFLSEFAAFGGVHVIARPEQHEQPITLSDEHGPVHFYGIPYLEPALVRYRYPDAELRSHEQVLGFVMDRVRSDLAERGGRSVAISHCFVANVSGSAGTVTAAEEADGLAALPDDSMRDITAGGLDIVPLAVFDGPDYVALGHIHGRATLSERVRYSGAPLHYSFSEAAKPRGAWLVELDASGLGEVEWVDLPIPRPLIVLTGTLEELLTDAAHGPRDDDWVYAILTDQSRPMDPMRRLQTRFRWCAGLELRPSVVAGDGSESYRERVKDRSDAEISAEFLEYVRNGVGASTGERALLAEVIAADGHSA